MAFKKFTGRRRSPAVSFWKSGQLYFNPAACDEMDLKSKSGIVFYYDEETKTVGMELIDSAVETEIENLYKITFRKDTETAICSIKAFCSYFQIELKKTRKYKITWKQPFWVFRVSSV